MFGKNLFNIFGDNIDTIGNSKKIEIKSDSENINVNIGTIKNEEDDMSKRKKRNTFYSTKNTLNNYYNRWQKTFEKPTERINNNILNIVAFKQKTLNEIMNSCLPKAGGSEFQFHYHALQAIIEDSSSNEKIIFTFPIAFFNFPQKVTSASVEFNLPQVQEISEKIKPHAKAIAKNIINIFPKKFFEEQGFNVRFKFGEIGSIHRHPGRFGFSSIDLRYDPTKPGVIYRVKEATELYQVDSVLYCDTNAELYTTETRLFNIKQVDPNDEDKGSTGTVETISTLTYILQDSEIIEKNKFSKFFGNKNSIIKKKFIIKEFQNPENYPEIEKIIEYVLNNYDMLNLVVPDMIEARIQHYSGSWNTTKNLWEYEDDYYYLGTTKTYPSYEEKRWEAEDEIRALFEEESGVIGWIDDDTVIKLLNNKKFVEKLKEKWNKLMNDLNIYWLEVEFETVVLRFYATKIQLHIANELIETIDL